MNSFPIIPATKQSLTRRKSVFCVGINDAPYTVTQKVNGKRVKCLFYQTWQGMLERCYSPKEHIRHPTYSACSTCDDWLYFMSFRDWMIGQDWKSKQLDKDIIKAGNKLYSPDTCIFVSNALNKLLIDHAARRGKFPIGVCYNKRIKKYQSSIKINGNQKHLGYFNTPEEASEVYREEKYNEILRHAKMQTDPRVKYGLIQHAELLFNDKFS